MVHQFGRPPDTVDPAPAEILAGRPAGLVDRFSQLVNHYSAELVDQ
ncbi:hypothetical protein [Burkholderia gladioli]|nr:hypothetical protein [Burkholderia gladioli]